MSATHWHLILNHFPIVTPVMAVPLLLIALWRRREIGALLGAVVLLIVTAGTGYASLETGEASEEEVEDLPGTSEPMLGEHEERAEVGTVVAAITAVGGLGVLGWAWRRGAVPVGGTSVLLVATLATTGAMAWVGLAGGQVRHDEIRQDWPGPMLTTPEKAEREVERDRPPARQ